MATQNLMITPTNLNFGDQRTYEWLAQLANEALCRSVTINAEGLRFVSGDLAAVIGAVNQRADDARMGVKWKKLPPAVDDSLRMTGVFGGAARQSSAGTMFPYSAYTEGDGNQFLNNLDSHLLENTHFPKGLATQDLQRLKASLGELFNNAHEHADCTHVHTCGQVFPNHQKLLFSVADLGNTFHHNVSDHLQQPGLSNAQAVKWAIQRGNSTRMGGQGGGVGLADIQEFVNQNKGELAVVSGTAAYIFSPNNQNVINLTQSFPGALVTLSINLVPRVA